MVVTSDLAYLPAVAMAFDPNDDERLWAALASREDAVAGAAAEAHLQQGRPVYYSEPDTPDGLLIKESPDGRRVLVRFEITDGEVRESAA